MLQDCAGQTAPSSPESYPEAYATVFSPGSDASRSEPASLNVSVASFENSTTSKPSPHREPHSSSCSSSLELRRSRQCYEGANSCEEVLSAIPLPGPAIEGELSLMYARCVCGSDAQLGAPPTVRAWPPVSHDPIEALPLLASRSSLESLYASEPPAAAPLSLSATRRSSPQPTITDAAPAPTASDGPSKIAMASVPSISLHGDSGSGSALHSRANPRRNRRPHTRYECSRGRLEMDVAVHSRGAAVPSSISRAHTHPVDSTRARSSPPLGSSATQSLVLTRLGAESGRGESGLILSLIDSPNGASCAISDALDLTPEKTDHLTLRAMTSEEACVPPLSDPIAVQRTAPPITTTREAQKRVNAQGGTVPVVPAIRLPAPYSVPVSDPERSLASTPALGYGPRSTPNACSLTSVRSGRSARSARHSSRCAAKLRNGLSNLKELFPTLPDELYLARDRLIISQDSKWRLGSGAYGTVQQAELYPPGVEVPHTFSPTAESLTSPSISGTLCFPPANRRISILSFSSIAATLGSSENVCGAINCGHCEAEETGGPGTTSPVGETSGYIHLHVVSTLSSDSVTPSALPLHQQPYNEQTASFYNRQYDIALWSSATESIKDSSESRAPSSNNDPTLNMTTAQATVLSGASGTCDTPVYGAVSTASSEFHPSKPQSPSSERPLQRETTAATPADPSCQAEDGLRGAIVLGLRSGRKAHVSAGSLTSPLVSTGDLRGRGHDAVTAVGGTDNNAELTSMCEEGKDCLAKGYVSVGFAKSEGEAAKGKTEAGTEYSMTSNTNRRTFPPQPSAATETCNCCPSIICVGRRAASEREEESAGSGPCTHPSFTSPTTRGDSIGTAPVAAAEGKRASCSEAVVPPVTVEVCMHHKLLNTLNLVSSKLFDDAGAAGLTLQAAAAVVVGADASGKGQVGDCDCLSNALPHSLMKGSSYSHVQATVVTPAKGIQACPSRAFRACEQRSTESPAVEESKEGKVGESVGEASEVPESQGLKVRRQSTREGLEVSRTSFLVSVSYPELQLTGDSTEDDVLTLTEQQVVKWAVREAEDEHQPPINQSPEETERLLGAGILRRRKGCGGSSAASEAQGEKWPDGKAAAATSADVKAEAAGEGEGVAERFTHLRARTPTLTAASTAGGTNSGIFAPLTHTRNSADASEILEAYTTPRYTSTSWVSSSTTLAEAAAAVSTMPRSTTTRFGNPSCTLVSNDTTNPLKLSLDFPLTPIVRYSVSSPMMCEALANDAVPFRSVATKVIKKADVAYNAMKLNAFHNELRMASRLHHPCLVNMLGVAEDTENFYLVMDLVENGNLAQYQQQFGVRDTREMAPRFMADIVLALEYLRDGSQHSYWMTPPSKSAVDSLLLDHPCSASGTLGTRGTAGTGRSLEPHYFPGSTSTQSLFHSSDSAAVPNVSTRLELCASNTLPLPAQHTSEAPGADEAGAGVFRSASAVGPVERESKCELLKSTSGTSSAAFGYGFPAPAQAATRTQQRAEDGKTLAWQDSVIVHRDVKPENLLLTWDFHVKLADFGDACFYGDDEANNFGGTPSYISPEMVAHCKASPYSDLWALGCVLYELLVGERLFSGSLVEVGIAVQTFRPEALAFPDFPTSASASSSTAKEVEAQRKGSGGGAAISEAAKDLVRQLLQPVPAERLGSAERGGFDALKAHPFFADIGWDVLLQTTNMTVTNTDYTFELAEYLEPMEAVVYCSPVKLLSAVERSSFKGCASRIHSNSSRSVQGVLVMVLTDAPRLFLVNPDLDMVSFEIPWSTEMRVGVLSADRFTITVPASGTLRFPSTPVPEALPRLPTTPRTSLTRGNGNLRTATESTITYTFSDRNRRADLWGVKIHHQQSVCPEKPDPGITAGTSLPHCCSTPVVSMSGGASHLPQLEALPQQQQHQQCRGMLNLSPRAGSSFLQRLRTNPRITRARSLGNLTVPKNEHTAGAPRSCACAGALQTRVTPAARARAASFRRRSVSPSSVFTLSSAATATASVPSAMLSSPHQLPPPMYAGEVLPSGQCRSTMTATVTSSTTSDSRHRSLHSSKVNVGSGEGARCTKSCIGVGCTQADAWAQSAVSHARLSTTCTSAESPRVSPTSTTAIPVAGEHSRQCGGDVSVTHWKDHLLTPVTSVCTSVGTLHPLSVSATATCVAGSVPESVLGCCISADGVTPRLACSGRFGGGGGEDRPDDSFEGVHENRSQSEGTPGPFNTPTQADSAIGTPAGMRLLGLCRDGEEGCMASGGTPISPLAGATSTAGTTATTFPMKTSQVRRQYKRAQKMKSEP